jgi:type II secretory pathway predicted ATPase ExeA
MVVPYLPYFKLKEEPYNTTANPRFFFLSPIHSVALGKTEFTVDAKKGLAIVFGDTGTGKSTLARLLHQKFLDKGYTSVLLTNPNYPTTNSLLRTIIQEFQLPKTAKSYKRTTWISLRCFSTLRQSKRAKTSSLSTTKHKRSGFPYL